MRSKSHRTRTLRISAYCLIVYRRCDLWSTGVILFMLLSGETPFPGKTEADILAKVKVGDFKFEDKTWTDISDEAMDLVTLLLQVDPEKRISAEEALHHRWYVRGRGCFS